MSRPDDSAAIRTVLTLVHNVIAHPILGVAQAVEDLAEWLHDRTAP